jgi:DNA repair protein RadC
VWFSMAMNAPWSPQHALAWCQALRSLPTEQILLLFCSEKFHVSRRVAITSGKSDMIELTPRDIFEHALGLPIHSLVVCHNHPRGSPTPSREDEVFTARLEAGCKLLGYTLLDHLIVTATEHYSFREAGKLLPLPEETRRMG